MALIRAAKTRTKWDVNDDHVREARLLPNRTKRIPRPAEAGRPAGRVAKGRASVLVGSSGRRGRRQRRGGRRAVRPPRLPSVVSTAVCIDRRLHVPILLPRHYPGCIFYLLSSRHLDD